MVTELQRQRGREKTDRLTERPRGHFLGPG